MGTAKVQNGQRDFARAKITDEFFVYQGCGPGQSLRFSIDGFGPSISEQNLLIGGQDYIAFRAAIAKRTRCKPDSIGPASALLYRVTGDQPLIARDDIITWEKCFDTAVTTPGVQQGTGEQRNKRGLIVDALKCAAAWARSRGGDHQPRRPGGLRIYWFQLFCLNFFA
nr:hypothetical protein [Pseudophaeobacter sp. EL27]